MLVPFHLNSKKQIKCRNDYNKRKINAGEITMSWKDIIKITLG